MTRKLDAYDQAAAEIAAALRAEPPEVQEAYRYLFARSTGVPRAIERQVLCRRSPKEWTAEEEQHYVMAIRRRPLGDSEQAGRE